MSADERLNEKLEAAIDASLPAVQSKRSRDDKDAKEEASLTHQIQRAGLEGLREDNRNKKANRRLRWRYAKWVFRYLVVFSLFSALIVILHGFGIGSFALPDLALGALVGSTAVSAIGLVAAVVTGLFQSS